MSKRFSGDNFGNATALVITFTVLNTKDDTFQQMALEWEEQFLALVRNYSSDNISFTYNYSAEVIMFPFVVISNYGLFIFS